MGTRPEIIKMSPVIAELERRRLDYFIAHTGQHYSYEMDRVFFQELQLPQARYNLDVGSGSHGAQTGKMLAGIEKILIEERPDVLLALGDTNSVFSGAMAAAKLHIAVGHVEAGLRSRDRSMPEEINRVLADHLGDWLFAPTQGAKENLLREGLPEDRIVVTGNTIVDALYRNTALAEAREDILHRFGLVRGGYFLVTAHREENVDVEARLSGILKGLELVHRHFGAPVLFPMHPRTRKRIREFGLAVPEGVQVINPLGYLDFLLLERHARLTLTDSGGVQEEACILKVPCVTLRDNTERPETIEVGANMLAGCQADRVLDAARQMADRPRDWTNPFGEGAAAARIVETITGSRGTR